jgi:CheY-like chemotaxis protein
MSGSGNNRAPDGLHGRSILIVEDEPVTALSLTRLLERAGATVVGPALSVADAQVRMADHRIDLALMDVNLGGDSRVFPLAEALAALRVPFAFVSGHPRALMPPHLHDRPFVAKPFSEREILVLVKKLLS